MCFYSGGFHFMAVSTHICRPPRAHIAPQQIPSNIQGARMKNSVNMREPVGNSGFSCLRFRALATCTLSMSGILYIPSCSGLTEIRQISENARTPQSLEQGNRWRMSSERIQVWMEWKCKPERCSSEGSIWRQFGDG